jgi:hypothetical protein
MTFFFFLRQSLLSYRESAFFAIEINEFLGFTDISFFHLVYAQSPVSIETRKENT